MCRPKTDEQKKVQFSLHVDPKVYEKIEENRGLVKRSTFVENILSKGLGVEI